MRKLPPLTAGLYDIQHGICQFALAPLPIPHSRIQWLYFFSLAVCQVRRVRLAPCSYFFHAAIIPCFTYEDKLLQVQNTFARPTTQLRYIQYIWNIHFICQHEDQLVLFYICAPVYFGRGFFKPQINTLSTNQKS